MRESLVSVVIPVLNERDRIRTAIEAIAGQSYPIERIEVVVVDGGSNDGTADEVERAFSGKAFAKGQIISNPVGTRPSNLNVGAGASKGEFICRVDARSVIPRNYIADCTDILSSRADVAVVGGAQVATAPHKANVRERGAVRALRNPVAMGGALYRRATASGPADTVYLGFFRRKQLLEAGGWDERLLVNEDFDLNHRMAELGTVWFDVRSQVAYEPRTSLRELRAQYLEFGRWKAAIWLERPGSFTARHGILLATPIVGFVGCALLYVLDPLVFGAGVLIALVGTDLAVREPAPPLVRLTGILVAVLIVTSWFTGIIQQLWRYARGQRLLSTQR